LAVGGTAFFNKNGVAVVNTAGSSGSGMAALPVSDKSQQAQVVQLQSLVDQYKAREQEYQTREQQYQQQLAAANTKLQQDDAQISQFQMLIGALQQKGVITITGDGRVFINR
jgi:malic enzyme